MFFQACDVTDIEALRAALTALIEKIGGVDVLVNNVANDARHTIESVTPEYFDERVAINLRPHFFAMQSVLHQHACAWWRRHHQHGLCQLEVQGHRLRGVRHLQVGDAGFHPRAGA